MRVGLANTVCRESSAVAAYELDHTRFKDVRVPVLMLLGDRSVPRMAAAARAVADALPTAKLQMLTDQEHVAMLTAPGLLAAEITAFAQGAVPVR